MRTRSRTETHPHAARPEWQNARAHRRYRLGPGSDCACSRPISARTAYPSCLNAIPQSRDRPRKRQEFPVDIPAPLCQYRAMLGETQKPILPHPPSAQYMRVRKKQIPISWMPSGYDGYPVADGGTSYPIADDGTNKSLTFPSSVGSMFLRLLHP